MRNRGEKKETRWGEMRRTRIHSAALVFALHPTPQKKGIKGEVVLNDFYSFASASLLFISLLFSLSPTAGRFSSWFSEAVFLEPLSAALCLSLAFFVGLAAAAAPGLLGLVRRALYLST